MSVHGNEQRKRTTVLTFQEKKQRGEPITELTAYDFPSATAVDESGVDAILVGDTLAMVMLGHPNTLSVTMDEMLHHARAVSRGGRRALLIGDLPFMSYQADPAEALRNAGRYLKEAGMDAVKLEGGRTYAATAAALVNAGIPVQGHVGLTPQSVNTFGGFKVQGRTAEAARTLLDDALALEDAGCFSIVLECVPEAVARVVTERLRVPTIGIGAGRYTSGQVLVTHDILGLYPTPPRFAPRYAEVAATMAAAVERFRAEVSAHVFPGEEHTFRMAEDEWLAFQLSIGERLPEPAPAVTQAS